MEGLAGWSSDAGPFVRAEAGYRPWEDFGAFAFGQYDKLGPMVGAGVRWEF